LTLIRFVTGVVLAVALGSSAVGRRKRSSASRLALDLAVGLAVAVPMVLGLALLGVPSRARFLATAEILLTIGFFLFRSERVTLEAQTSPPPQGRTVHLSLFVLGLTFLAAAGKWFRVPLWSWDHFAIWGMKARKIVQDGMLDFGFLRPPAFRYSNPDYPVGLPLSWRVLSLALPEEPFFKGVHALFALALVLLLRRIVLRVSESHLMANTLAAFVCVSPLFWDTEALGLADLPLAFFAIASIAILLEARDSLAPVWTAGLLMGFVSWIKTEGALLSLLLLAFGALLLLRSGGGGQARVVSRVAGLALPVLLLNLACSLIGRSLLSPGLSFFAGDWAARADQRLRHPGQIIRPLAGELLRVEWGGLWLLFAATFLFCVLKKRVIPAFLFGIVFVMLGSYCAVYFATYLDPVQHLENSFFRVAAALIPLGTIGIAFVFEADPPGRAASAGKPGH
jgi:hypothetical protein